MTISENLIQYNGAQNANIDYHDGQLRPVVGVHNYQILRANRSHPEQADHYGWTYNHAPMLAHWNGQFFLEYLSNPVSEHVAPGLTFLTVSEDGVNWEKPKVVFPAYLIPSGVYVNLEAPELPENSFAVMHQRMGFYVSPEDRLLVIGFYGICPHYKVHPNDGKGIGRVVREIYRDGSWGPIYFIRYNRHAGWNESNTHFPSYQTSSDSGFIEACEALLADKLVTMQWWEEDRSKDGFYTTSGGKAPSTYRLPDGRLVAVFKSSRASITSDDGKTWSKLYEVPTLIMAGAKIWGQQTADGRYALVYNPSPTGKFRWPLAVVVSEDGLNFDRMAVIHGDVSPMRYSGEYKDYGPQYIRGIEAGNQVPTGNEMWLTYSVNKEDIWVSRVPSPLNVAVDQTVQDTFSDMPLGSYVKGWNIYSCQWARVSIEPEPSTSIRSLRLQDKDPYEYAKAVRVFPESRKVHIECKLLAAQNDTGQLYLEVCDFKGTFPLRLIFDSDGWIKYQLGGQHPMIPYQQNTWYVVSLTIDCIKQSFELIIGDFRKSISFFAPVLSIERLVFRTGAIRKEPNLDSRLDTDDIPGADEQITEANYYLSYVNTSEHE
ncbi:exo-alpha-sialidase [Paenibacillus sp. UNC451MF]|uniref:exo-alpha-sialidase n=1 Tax=Paenibacillus sp. UNC451MF TaxID=1449063 RepID=UPI00068E2622|nr:exo-alpha-sialidase [Paenibacillus sp. UNC451MF]